MAADVPTAQMKVTMLVGSMAFSTAPLLLPPEDEEERAPPASGRWKSSVVLDPSLLAEMDARVKVVSAGESRTTPLSNRD